MSEKKPEIDLKIIKNIASILKKENLGEIEIKLDNFKLRISNAAGIKYEAPSSSAYVSVPHHPFSDTPSINQIVQNHLIHPSEENLLKNQVLSPMVGTAYSAASPGSKPFIELGQMVEEGQTLLIIEAMKTMNHIPAPRSGKVTQIFFKDGQPIEFDEPLIILE